ncbi:MAG: hypoxanthine phosphoribosyltransferase [Ruminococcaceae bacterium]|nr:hypoxanthine phosphoribosyltransferase [Oscillospiraceae bacterium]
MRQDVESVLVSEEELGALCDRLAAQITEDFRDSGRDLVFVTVLKGSIMFAADLIRRIPIPCTLEFMKVSSYGSLTQSSGFIQVHLDLKRDVKDCDVIIVEDIIDSGRTLQRLSELLENRGAHTVRCCTLLDKPDRRKVNYKAHYVGTVIPDAFVVGYGLDYDEKYRNLPYVGVLAPKVYNK